MSIKKFWEIVHFTATAIKEVSQNPELGIDVEAKLITLVQLIIRST